MGWKEDLAVEHKDLGFLKDLPDDSIGLNNLVKSAHHAQQKIREKGVIPPHGDDATIADYDHFYSSLGRPTEKRGYEPKDFPEVSFAEDAERDSKFEGALLQELYDSGMNPKQAERVFKGYAKDLERRKADHDEQAGEVEAKVDRDLSEAFGLAKEARLADAWEALVAMVGEETAGQIVDTDLSDGRKIGDLVPLLTGLSKQGQALRGHDGMFPGGNRKAGFKGHTPEEAAQELMSKKADKEWSEAWIDKKHPRHAVVQAEFEALSQRAGGVG